MLNSILQTIIPIIEKIQTAIDVEGYFFLGIEMDRYAHFFLVFFLMSVFMFFRQKKYGLIFCIFIVFFKEVVDLGVVYYYEPIKMRMFIDSSIDLTLGFCGMFSAYFFFDKLGLVYKNRKK